MICGPMKQTLDFKDFSIPRNIVAINLMQCVRFLLSGWNNFHFILRKIGITVIYAVK